MNIISMTSHDLAGLDTRHAGLLTLIVIGWFVANHAGWWAERRGLKIVGACLAGIFLLVAGCTIVDAWLGLATVQFVMFFLLGVADSNRSR